MGEQALSGPSAHTQKLSITDPKLCRSYLVGTCPHDLFTNTKQDFGPCTKLHSQTHKDDYENAKPEQKKQWGFEYDYARDMGKYVSECDRRIEGAQRRLEKTADEVRQTNVLLKQIGEFNSTIENGLMEVEVLAEEGAVNLAVQEYFKIRQTKLLKDEKERELKALSDTSGPSGHQKLQVCDVCGAYLSRLDNDRRLADHFYGKMHLGYAQMRKTYDALQKELKTRGPAPQRADDGSAGPRGDFDGGFDRGYGGRGGFRGGSGGFRGRGGFRGGGSFRGGW